jgi:hypothetical protein
VAALDRRVFPDPAAIAAEISGDAEVVQLPADCADVLSAFRAHPEWVLDPDAGDATSGFTLSDPDVVDHVVAKRPARPRFGRLG